jgi:hypothetical protein
VKVTASNTAVTKTNNQSRSEQCWPKGQHALWHAPA